MYLKDPDGVLKTVKSQSVDGCTLLVLNGRHLSYVAEEVVPDGEQRRRIFHTACINGVIL